MRSLSDMFKAVYDSEGWEGVWRKHYRKLQKFSLEERRIFIKKMKRRFGSNNRRAFREEMFTPYEDTFMSRIKKDTQWVGEAIAIPFYYEPGSPEETKAWEEKEALRPVELKEDERYIYLDGYRYEGPLRRAIIKRMGFDELKALKKQLEDSGTEWEPNP